MADLSGSSVDLEALQALEAQAETLKAQRDAALDALRHIARTEVWTKIGIRVYAKGEAERIQRIRHVVSVEAALAGGDQ